MFNVNLLYADIDTFCINHYKENPRNHLGASIIGHDCTAYCWNVFRWVKQESFNGQMYRLFNRGHKEEARIIEWLQGVGAIVNDIDPETQKQYRISSVNGHFGGSLDSLILLPEKYGFNGYIIGEFKTHNEKSFTKLAGKKNHYTELSKPRIGGEGVKKSKPQHFKQMSCYGHAYGIKYGLYCAVNKDTDELYFEFVELDFYLADDLFRKAEHVINSQVMPAKIAMTESFMTCKFCNFSGICHRGEQPDINCRSCINAQPVENGEWYCHKWNNIIPKDFLLTACGNWKGVV